VSGLSGLVSHRATATLELSSLLRESTACPAPRASVNRKKTSPRLNHHWGARRVSGPQEMVYICRLYHALSFSSSSLLLFPSASWSPSS
jgi:hypothetical protein